MERKVQKERVNQGKLQESVHMMKRKLISSVWDAVSLFQAHERIGSSVLYAKDIYMFIQSMHPWQFQLYLSQL